MINLFRETYSSLQDSYYGKVIINKSLRQVVWYWTKYLLLLGAVMVLYAIFFMTNRLPQIPKFIQSSIPEGKYELNQGIFSSSIDQPYVTGNSEFSFVIDTEATPSALNPYQSGIVISKNDIILKSADGTISTQSMKNFPSFSFSPANAASLISDNFIKVWVILFIGIVLMTLFIGTLFWLQKFISFAIWSLIILIVTKYVIKQNISYIATLKIVIFASVLPLLLSLVLSATPNPVQDILGLGVMAYFAFNWIRHLETSTSQPVLLGVSPKKTTQNKPPKH